MLTQAHLRSSARAVAAPRKVSSTVRAPQHQVIRPVFVRSSADKNPLERAIEAAEDAAFNVQDKAEKLGDKIWNSGEDTGAKVQSTAKDVQKKAEKQKDKIVESNENPMGNVQRAAESIKDNISELANTASERLGLSDKK